MNKKYRLQLVATVLMLVSSVYMIREALIWYEIDGWLIFSGVFYAALLAGSGILTVYYKTGNHKLLMNAHVTLLIGFSFRFCDFASQCLFSEDVPGYSIFLFDLLPAPALVSEIAILVLLKKKARSERWKKIVLTNCMIQSLFWGVVLIFGILSAFASTYAMIESIGGLYGVTLFITFLNTGSDFVKDERMN